MTPEQTREENIHKIMNHIIMLSRIYPDRTVVDLIYDAKDLINPLRRGKMTNTEILRYLAKFHKVKASH